MNLDVRWMCRSMLPGAVRRLQRPAAPARHRACSRCYTGSPCFIASRGGGPYVCIEAKPGICEPEVGGHRDTEAASFFRLLAHPPPPCLLRSVQPSQLQGCSRGVALSRWLRRERLQPLCSSCRSCSRRARLRDNYSSTGMAMSRARLQMLSFPLSMRGNKGATLFGHGDRPFGRTAGASCRRSIELPDQPGSSQP